MIDGEIQWCRPLVIIGFEISSRFDKAPELRQFTHSKLHGVWQSSDCGLLP